jgi:hypothetical protein
MIKGGSGAQLYTLMCSQLNDNTVAAEGLGGIIVSKHLTLKIGTVRAFLVSRDMNCAMTEFECSMGPTRVRKSIGESRDT